MFINTQSSVNAWHFTTLQIDLFDQRGMLEITALRSFRLDVFMHFKANANRMARLKEQHKRREMWE